MIKEKRKFEKQDFLKGSIGDISDENGEMYVNVCYVKGTDYVISELEETIRRIKGMKIKTWDEWLKVKDIFVCPKCWSKKLDIDYKKGQRMKTQEQIIQEQLYEKYEKWLEENTILSPDMIKTCRENELKEQQTEELKEKNNPLKFIAKEDNFKTGQDIKIEFIKDENYTNRFKLSIESSKGKLILCIRINSLIKCMDRKCRKNLTELIRVVDDEELKKWAFSAGECAGLVGGSNDEGSAVHYPNGD